MIEVNSLVKTYGNKKALNNFDMYVRKNTIHALVGPNGSGKSTVIKILSTDIKPDAGDVTIDGVAITDVKKVRSMVSVVEDLSGISGFRSARNVLEAAGKGHKLSREEVQYRIEVLSDTLGLENELDRKIGELSKGMRRRVSLGISLISDSSVIIMDGSLADLDPGFSVRFMDMMHDIGDKTIVLTANNMNLVDRVCDGVTIIKDGMTLLNESMLSIREKIGRPAVTFKVSPINIPRLEAALKQQIFVNKTYAGDDTLLVEVDNMLHIPAVIRHATTFTEIYEARQTMMNLEDLYHTFIES